MTEMILNVFITVLIIITFAKKGVPAVFFFSGIHADYHKPSDTPDKIDYPLMTTRTKLIFHTAWELANSDERIKVDRDGE